jgi:hypothetical protein
VEVVLKIPRKLALLPQHCGQYRNLFPSTP